VSAGRKGVEIKWKHKRPCKLVGKKVLTSLSQRMAQKPKIEMPELISEIV
jgi:hypothetical protein